MKSRVFVSVVTMVVVLAMLTVAGLAVADRCAVRAAEGQSAGPEAAAEAFYGEWIGALRGRDGGFDPLSYRDSAYLSARLVAAVDETRESFGSAAQGAGGYDPLLCAQDVPAAWQVTEAAVDGDTAEAAVEMLWTGNPMAYRVPVALRQVGGVWRLDEVRCNLATHEPLTAEQIVAQFYDIYLDVTGRTNPLTSQTYRNLPFISADLVAKVDALLVGFDRGGYDPFLCAQDIPTSVTAGKAGVDGGLARVPVSTSFEGHGFTVALEQETAGWVITDIQCQMP